MSEELQGLLKRIQDEGISKADQEKAEIIAAAKAEAAKMLEDAKAEAEALTKKAEEEAANTISRGNAAMSQASRDILLKLRNEMVARLDKIVKDSIKEAMTGAFMGKIIGDMLEVYKKSNSDANPTLEVMVAPADLEKLQTLLKGSLAASFQTAPRIFTDSDIGSGLKISFHGSDVFYDFSDDALGEVIAAYVGPRFAEFLKK